MMKPKKHRNFTEKKQVCVVSAG